MAGRVAVGAGGTAAARMRLTKSRSEAPPQQRSATACAAWRHSPSRNTQQAPISSSNDDTLTPQRMLFLVNTARESTARRERDCTPGAAAPGSTSAARSCCTPPRSRSRPRTPADSGGGVKHGPRSAPLCAARGWVRGWVVGGRVGGFVGGWVGGCQPHRSGWGGGEGTRGHELGAENKPEERLDEVGRRARGGDHDILCETGGRMLCDGGGLSDGREREGLGWILRAGGACLWGSPCAR